MNYSVAIRTLGESGNLLKREIESLINQSIPPKRIIIYIANGYQVPNFRVADEKYVFVEKGMMAQQALEYKEIDTDLILKLDDDVEFTESDDIENMIDALIQGNYDCIAADTFKNHRMSFKAKIFAAITNLTFPHFNQNKAFKIRMNGSFSYLYNPKKNVVDSESAAGPCSLWRKNKLLDIELKEELWIDKFGFSYGDDQVIFQKLIRNKGKLAILYNSGVLHADGKTASKSYHNNPEKFKIRSLLQTIIWHRTILSTQSNIIKKIECTSLFILKTLWGVFIHIVASLRYHSLKIPFFYIKGNIDGIRYINSIDYKNLKPFVNRP